MSNSYNSSALSINPVLGTFPAGNINIQPYWIVVLQLIFVQFLQRIWNYFQYKTCFTTLEIAGLIRIFQQYPTSLSINSNTSLTVDKTRLVKLRNMISISYFEAINCLLIFGHSIWYCIIQSSCLQSSSVATTWNCYNAFGYRLYNYVFVSYSSTTLNCIYVIYMEGYQEIIKSGYKQGSFCSIIYYISLIIIVITLPLVTCLLLPFFLTNVIPMFIIYIWISTIYIVVSSYLIFTGFFVYDDIDELRKRKEFLSTEEVNEEDCCSFMFTQKEIPHVAFSIILALFITTFPILLSIFFNYSQFFYYGDGYLSTIQDDFNSRSTEQYFNILQNSIKQILHSLLNFL
ncbi:unnamed protein product [Adineta steineri]|uniref:Uncharacterized protein n=2 Tax=Adineta steineri TaxID=433720 RepID=A0A815MYG3_9BILA|nr:unnamed protein product [Adineta steineri]